LPRVAEDMV